MKIIYKFLDAKLFDIDVVINWVFNSLSSVNHLESDFGLEFEMITNLLWRVCHNETYLREQIAFHKV